MDEEDLLTECLQNLSDTKSILKELGYDSLVLDVKSLINTITLMRSELLT